MAITLYRLPVRPTVFVLPGDPPPYSSTVAVSTPSCTKVPGESRQFAFNFGDYPELAKQQQTLTGTPSIASDTIGLSLGSPSISGNEVLCQIAGGMDATDYTLTVTCGTSDGLTTLAGVGVLQVRAKP